MSKNNWIAQYFEQVGVLCVGIFAPIVLSGNHHFESALSQGEPALDLTVSMYFCLNGGYT